MSQGLGDPLADTQPLIDGNVDMTDQGTVEYTTLGCHKGDFRGLNVRYPDLNMDYEWLNDRPQSLMAAAQRGQILVGAEDQEMSANADLLGLEPSPLDSSCMYAGMRLAKTPIEIVRRRKEQQERLHNSVFKDGPTERKYFDRSTEEEARLGGRRGLRFMHEDHETSVTAGFDPAGRRLDSWRPNLGLDYERG
jgi:hypothetical protein